MLLEKQQMMSIFLWEMMALVLFPIKIINENLRK